VTDEIKQLNHVTQTEFHKLDNVKSHVTTARQTMDTDTMLHTYYASQIQKLKQPWNSVAAFYMSVTAILGVFYIHLYPHTRNTPQQNDPTHVPSTTTPDPQPRTEVKNEDPKRLCSLRRIPCNKSVNIATH